MLPFLGECSCCGGPRGRGEPHGASSLKLMFRFSHERGRHATDSMQPWSLAFLNSRKHIRSLLSRGSALGSETDGKGLLLSSGSCEQGTAGSS